MLLFFTVSKKKVSINDPLLLAVLPRKSTICVKLKDLLMLQVLLG
jgi:hypothetical protein